MTRAIVSLGNVDHVIDYDPAWSPAQLGEAILRLAGGEIQDAIAFSLAPPAPAPRGGDWLQTFLGKQFWPIDPRAADVEIEDIAHSLSMICRFGGHCLRFYSVAEHSVHIFRSVARVHRLWALLHDAPESYVLDVPRPLKPFLTGYRDIESGVMACIAERFGLVGALPGEVKQADRRILVDEMQQAMLAPPAPWDCADLEPLGVELQFWSPAQARDEFLAAYREAVAS